MSFNKVEHATSYPIIAFPAITCRTSMLLDATLRLCVNARVLKER